METPEVWPKVYLCCQGDLTWFICCYAVKYSMGRIQSLLVSFVCLLFSFFYFKSDNVLTDKRWKTFFILAKLELLKGEAENEVQVDLLLLQPFTYFYLYPQTPN